MYNIIYHIILKEIWGGTESNIEMGRDVEEERKGEKELKLKPIFKSWNKISGKLSRQTKNRATCGAGGGRLNSLSLPLSLISSFIPLSPTSIPML